jgi:hypothetical protein
VSALDASDGDIAEIQSRGGRGSRPPFVWPQTKGAAASKIGKGEIHVAFVEVQVGTGAIRERRGAGPGAATATPHR